MNYASFLVRDQDTAAKLGVKIARLKVERPLEVIIRPFKEDDIARHRRKYWAWLRHVNTETGGDEETLDRLHKGMKKKFLGYWDEIEGEQVYVVPSITDLETDAEWEGYLDNIAQWAGATLGVLLPPPDRRNRGSRPGR